MRRSNVVWTLAITSLALFMVVLDNLVVSTALPVIRTDLGASIEELEWTVNAYTLTFAVFLLTGAALGGIALAPLALLRLRETYGTDKALDLPGLALVSAGLLGLVGGLGNGNADGWTSPRILAALGLGAVLLAAFVRWEPRARTPMLPMRFFRSRTFAAANTASLIMTFGMFGAIFLLTQFFQTAQGHSPLQAALRVLPWTLMPMVVAPVAGALSDRIGGRLLLASGLGLQALGLAWNAAVTEAAVGYASLVGPFVISGIGMGLFFAPLANVVLGSVARDEEGKASGANNAVREVGSVC